MSTRGDRSEPGAGDLDSLSEEPGDGDTFEQELGSLLGAEEGPALLGLEGRVLAGKYRLEALIGEGGMGQVYRATHLETGGLHAVKLLLPGSADRAQAQRRFQLEARNAAALLHPNTVRTTDFGQDGRVLYLVMEYVEGETLEEIIRREGPIGWRRAVRILAQILQALWGAHEHERRIIHRDIKPANILLCDTAGASDFVKVADFGISRALEGTGVDTRGVIGSPLTMAPELWRGGPVDARTDLYAVGCTAYHMLSGRRVFHEVTGASLGHHHLHEAPEPLADRVRPETPAALTDWVERMMAKDSDERYATASEALRALEAIEEADPAPPRPSATGPVGTDRARRWRLVLLSAGLVVLVGVAAVLVWRYGRGSAPPEAPAASTAHAAVDASGRNTHAAQGAYHHCSDAGGEGTACSEGFVAWCDADERPLACCMVGMVPVDDSGICDCAPGGTDHPAALENGCPAAATAEEQRAAIRVAFHAASDRYRACYEAALEADHERRPQGTLVVGLEVGPSGAVYSARIREGSLPAPSVQRCLLDVVRGVRFPPPLNGWMSINYPLHMRVSEDEDAHR